MVLCRVASTNGINEEFEAGLKTLGWSKAELARRLGLHPNSVSKWSEPPLYAMAYLRVMVKLKEIVG